MGFSPNVLQRVILVIGAALVLFCMVERCEFLLGAGSILIATVLLVLAASKKERGR